MDQSLLSLSSASAVGTQQQPATISFFNPRPLPARIHISSSRRTRRSYNSQQQHRLHVIRSCSSYHIQHQLTSSSSLAIEFLFQHAFVSTLQFFPTTTAAFLIGTTAAALLFYNNQNTTATRHHDLHENEITTEIGEWRLFTSPTPFNRFLVQRCPSLNSFDYLHSGPIRRGTLSNTTIEYQRSCIPTSDGGVISLDFPSHLDDHHDLTNQRDTTILIIPGTSDGSMDPDVTSFVTECLKRGCFPIVVNPRGAARSPLTTPRLFTPADSDDINTAVHFINSTARPWTALMAVGFGYGANMLTKYLAEVGEDTPLTAATCLDNPFDLTVPPPNQQTLTQGFIQILQSNKELFQGRSKGFDVEKALQAKSLKDFEEAISMVSYGFNTLEEFHKSSSTKDVVGNVKIPLLFIQDNAAPSSSIPRSSIAENPYTSLLTCSFRPDDKSITGTSDVTWCQHLVVEWLTAVELGLLKGRHPLLEDTDVTINPSKRLKLMESKESDASSRSNNLLNLRLLDSSNGNASNPSEKMVKKSDENVYSSSGLDLQNNVAKDKGINGAVTQTDVVGSEVMKEGDVIVDAETGQVVRATEVAMKMLDVTMPETLSEEQKRKVRTAVAQGETLMTALQGAVPEDVRGKLTSSVAEILKKQKKNSNGVPSVSNVSGATSAFNPQIRETSEPNASELNKRDTSSAEASSVEDSNKPSTKNDASEPQAPTLGTRDSNQVQSTSKEKEPNASELDKGDTSSAEDPNKPSTKNDVSEPQPPMNESNSSPPGKPERSGNSEDHTNEQAKVGHEDGTKVEIDNQQKDAQPEKSIPTPKTEESSSDAQPEKSIPTPKTEESSSDAQPVKSIPTPKTEESSSDAQPEKSIPTPKTEESSADAQPEKSIPTPKTEESSSPASSSPPENQLMAKEDGANQKKEESSAQPVPVPPNSNPGSPSFGVSQAFDALTGMDDSTQLAVNSVFSVIEDVITQLEGNREDDSAIADKDKIGDRDTDPKSESDLQQNGNGAVNMTTDPEEPGNLSVSNLSSDNKDEARVFENDHNDIQHSITKLPYRDPQNHHLSNMKNKLLVADSATSLSIDHVPKEGQRKLLEQSGDGLNVPSDVKCKDDIIEPAYVILDTERDGDPVKEYKKIGENEEIPQVGGDASVVLMQLVKENILNSLKVEVCRRIHAADMKAIAPMLKKELEEVANTVSLAVVHDKQLIVSWDGHRFGDLQAEHILDVISLAVEGTRYMKEVVPVGIVVGSSLASLRKSFNIVAADSAESTEVVRDHSLEGHHLQADWVEADEMPSDKVKQSDGFYSEDEGYEDEDASSSLRNDTVMAGAVTAALGATALLVHQQGTYNDELDGSTTSSMSIKQKENYQETSKSSDDNIVTSLAEKAMSVAAPVLPTKEDGGVDQDRLVTMLADLGQRGGILRLVGKFALLWGGIRGAMSLIGKLITFLRLSERPLYQRILGFVSLVLVLWTPFVVPLLPTLVQNLAEHNSSKFAVLACIIGLYSSVMILIVLWGQRIRGYEDPLKKYGLELTSAKQVQNFFGGLIGGVMLVLLIQSTNVLVGSVSISWPTIPSSTDAVSLLKLFGEGLRIVGQGLLTTAAIALVEETLFRSWLPEEIAVDLGFNRGIILSGLAFSLCQWSPTAIPGLWLLSVGLSGVRQRCQGSLFVPIGLRTGIMASSFVLKEGGFLIYQPTYPLWLSGGDPFQPFSSIVGLAVAILWAVILYPKKTQQKIKE